MAAWSWSHCAALRTSFTAAGAGAAFASRYSTFATTMPCRTNGKQNNFEHVLLVAFHPAASVNDDHAGPVGERRRAGLQNIEDGLRIMVVADIGLDLVIGSGGDREHEGEQ